MQAVSVKVGERYGPEYVNQLYKQLLSFDKNVVYYCMTDNAEGLNKNIAVSYTHLTQPTINSV